MNRKLTTLFAAAALTIIPAATFARDRDNDRHEERRWETTGGIRVNLDLGHPRIEERATQVWVEPAYRTVIDHVFVAPTYRTVTDRVWCPGTTQNVTQRVWVGDRFETHDVVRYEHGRRFIVREQVLVAPGHYEDQLQQVVTPGHYDDVQRQELVCAGHYEDVQRQEVINPGHFETRVAEVEHRDGLAVRFPIRW